METRVLLAWAVVTVLLWSSTTQASMMEDDQAERDRMYRTQHSHLHECVRLCHGQEPPKICYYKFDIEWYQTLSKACYNCPANITDCARPHCVAANGVHRGIVTANRQLPGPSIQVCKNDIIVVDVKNMLRGEETTIHWHGFHMKKTPYYDGVPMITQCPIHSHTTFRYQFKADQAGTHYWHSHSGLQRADGLYGAIVVRDPDDPHLADYDYDLPEHILVVTDWLNEIGVDRFAYHHNSVGHNKPQSILVNGKGVYHKEPGPYTPFAEFEVDKSFRYRFRAVSNGILNCPIEISIDGHKLLIIATDGTPVETLSVDSFVIYAGERFDFILDANQPVDNYWIKFRGIMDCDERFINTSQAAILRYSGANQTAEPEGGITYMETKRKGIQLNPLNKDTDGDDLSIVELNGLQPMDPRLTGPTMDYQFHLAYDFNPIDNKYFHHPEYYPLLAMNKNLKMFTPQINDLSLTMLGVPLLTQPEDYSTSSFCNETTMSGKNCSRVYCECPYVLQVPLNSTVELVIIDKGVTFDANHPLHLHGYSFFVISLKRVNKSVTVEEVKRLDKAGKVKRKFDRPVQKDSITVPDGGYTIVRFVANNPGYWFMHCHIAFHSEVGMGVIFKVGEQSDFVKPPPGFPRCGSFLPSIDNVFDNSRQQESSAGCDVTREQAIMTAVLCFLLPYFVL